MPLEESLAAVLSSPTAADVWRLRGELLEAGTPPQSRIWPVLSALYGFLDRLATGTSSRDYSQLASKLDIGAISGVILEHLTEQTEPSERAMRLLSGALSEGLMALATRQHVQAWQGELESVYREACWPLFHELWLWSEELKPNLGPGERRRLIDRLMAPALSPDTPGIHKTVIVGRLYQILVASHVSRIQSRPDR